MPSKKTLAPMIAALAVTCGFLAAAPAFAASKEKVLYSFCSVSGCADGEYPWGLIFDASGNLYGVADGGAYGYGVIFQLTPGAGGTWTEKVLYSFCSGGWPCNDGAYPVGSLNFDKAGNLYGMTTAGGSYQAACGASDCGTAFELSPSENGTWTEAVLHSFNDDGKDGVEPAAGVTSDTAGHLYGTTLYGGAHGGGIVFELSPGSNGTWTETVLHNFCSVRGCADGSALMAGVVFDKKGNLYGTTTGGGNSNTCGTQGCGVVFELKPGASGKWKQEVLYNFTSRGGSEAGLILDAAGNLYGTTPETVFELKKNDGWAKKVLHTFGRGNDGSVPTGNLIFSAGNLYGTTGNGGNYHTCLDGSGCGTVFQLTRQSNGTWKETILHSFTDNGEDGTFPNSGVILDTKGNLYGPTAYGGTGPCQNSVGEVVGCGTVFEITP